MSYTKIVQGWLEISYDDAGDCTELKFVPNDSAEVDRRDENDDLIEDAAVIADLESREKHVDFEMEQP